MISIDDVALGLGISKGRVLEVMKDLRIPLRDGAVPEEAFLLIERARRKGHVKAPPIRKAFYK